MIKNKLSDLISIQLPDHIRESYPTFVEFLQAYYKFLETQNVYRNLETIRDVDETIDIFIDQLKKEFAVDFPQFARDRQFLKNTPHIAVSHGSEESYKFLFRKMFQKEVDIRYPREQLLTISDSKWVQDFSIFVKLTSGDILSLQNNVVFLNTIVNGISTKNRIYVKRVESVLTSESIYELFINKDVYGKVLFGDTINQDGVVASVVNTTTSIKIKKAGFGFKVGQVFNIESDVGSGLTFKVIEVTALGGIKSTQIINYGINYKSSFSFDLPSTFLIGDVVETTLGTPIKISAFSSIQRYIDSGIISKQNYYTSDYSTDYVGEVMTSFNSVTVAEEITANSAELEVVLGTLAKYQGYYENSTGLVSSPDSVIQDNNYYQKYSYVLRIDEALSSYKETVMSLLHPIGRKLFAEYVVDNIFELNYEVVEPVFRILLPLFAGIPTVVNALSEFNLLFDKPVTSVQLTSDDDFYLFEQSTTTLLTSFDDPTLLDSVSGRVKGSFKTYLFESIKASTLDPQEFDRRYLFEQPLGSPNALNEPNVSKVIPITQLVELVVEKDVQTPMIGVESANRYLFEKEDSPTLLTSFDDPTLLDSVSGRVKGSFKTYLFDIELKDSRASTISFGDPIFVSEINLNAFPATNPNPAFTSILQAELFVHELPKVIVLNEFPATDPNPAFTTVLPQQTFSAARDIVLNEFPATDPNPAFTSILQAGLFLHSVNIEQFYQLLSSFSPSSSPSLDYVQAPFSSPPVTATDTVPLLIDKLFSRVVPPTIENVLANVQVTGTAGTFTCNQIYFGQNVFTISVTGTNTGTGSISGYIPGVINLYELLATNGSVTPNTFTLAEYGTNVPIATTAGTLTGLTFTRNNSSLNLTPSQSFVINSDSGNVFFNQYNDDFSYFADETYLARTRTF